MNLEKSYEFFNPDADRNRVHIIGCGSVGSTIAENLVRCGVEKISLYDFDTVEEHNIANQMFRDKDIGRNKAEALKEILAEINPDAAKEIRVNTNGWNGEEVMGYIFMCVDSMDVRRAIFEAHKNNPCVPAVFDVRTLLTGAQHYAASWADYKQRDNLWRSMQFTDEQADESTPVSACGVVLGVATTIRLISALAVNNYIKFAKGEKNWKFVQIDGFSGILDCFE